MHAKALVRESITYFNQLLSGPSLAVPLLGIRDTYSCGFILLCKFLNVLVKEIAKLFTYRTLAFSRVSDLPTFATSFHFRTFFHIISRPRILTRPRALTHSHVLFKL